MSATITLDKPLVSSVPRSMHHLMTELDCADIALPEQLEEINVLEMLYQRPFIESGMAAETTIDLTEVATIDARELMDSLTAFTVDVSCMFIALAAAMPFVPRVIGKSIYVPLVRRLRS